MIPTRNLKCLRVQFRPFSDTRIRSDEKSFLYNRLKQLLEDSEQIDDSVKIERDALPIQRDYQMQKLIDKLELKQYDAQYSKEISYGKIPDYASKHSKEIALGSVWKGSESAHDLNLRMLVDVHKPLKTQPRLLRSTRTRLNNAREGSLNYSLAKLSEQHDDTKNDGWTERYRERLLGPELLGPTTISTTVNSIKALADRKIEDARNRGDFDNLPNRGRPLPTDPNARSAYLDITEYHLNNILIRQDITPPWIEKQGSVLQLVDSFRKELDKLWLKRAVLVLNEKYPAADIEFKLSKALQYSENEKRGQNQLRDPEWIKEQDSYLTAKINSLNDSIRGYNLQAPLASQKFYLVKEKELEQMFNRVNSSHLHNGLKRFLLGDPKPQQIRQTKPGLYLLYSEIPQRDGQESLGRLFLNIFKSS